MTNAQHNVKRTFRLTAESLGMKLIEPATKASPHWQSLRKGEGLHHMCLRTNAAAATSGQHGARGKRVLSPPAIGEGSDDGLIAFGFAGCGPNVEHIDTDRRRDEISLDYVTAQRH